MKHDDLFERLDPPPGGLERLRARLREDEPKGRFRPAAPLALGFSVAVLAIVIVVATRPKAFDPVAGARRFADGAEIALGLAPMPANRVSIDGGSRATTALAEVRTANPNVAFYWVSSTQWSD